MRARALLRAQTDDVMRNSISAAVVEGCGSIVLPMVSIDSPCRPWWVQEGSDQSLGRSDDGATRSLAASLGAAIRRLIRARPAIVSARASFTLASIALPEEGHQNFTATAAGVRHPFWRRHSVYGVPWSEKLGFDLMLWWWRKIGSN